MSQDVRSEHPRHVLMHMTPLVFCLAVRSQDDLGTMY